MTVNDVSTREFAFELSHASTGSEDLQCREALELGVVIEARDITEPRRWLCVQPLCDSVRLNEEALPGDTVTVRMPFLPYRKVDAAPFDLVFEQRAGQPPLQLRLSVSPSDIRHVDFRLEPDEGSILARLVDGVRGFVDGQGRSWSLICRLKAAHAHRVAQRLGTEISRIGLNESEWLRLQGKKPR